MPAQAISFPVFSSLFSFMRKTRGTAETQVCNYENSKPCVTLKCSFLLLTIEWYVSFLQYIGKFPQTK